MIKLIDIILENLEKRRSNIQKYIDDMVDSAPGKNRGEKVQWLWANDSRMGKVVRALSQFNRYKPPDEDAYKASFQADKYYIRFGDIPQGGKSTNHYLKRPEKGISAYPAKWSKKHNMWELDTNELSDVGINTLDSLIDDFFNNKGRPIYLIHGQELMDRGHLDDESLLDANKIKVLKKLKPEEVWIQYYGGNKWAEI